jgi:hypothetical protein
VRAFEPAGEGGEVERDLLHPALAQQLDRPDDDELHQAVGGAVVPPHQEREGHRRAAEAGHEVDERPDAASPSGAATIVLPS